jgi:predicted kinase
MQNHFPQNTVNDSTKFHRPALRPANTESRRPGELVVIRGLPGSGKSTMANVLTQVGYRHYEADMFFIDNGVYRYEASRIKDAHAWCRQQVRQALQRGEKVVVSNTFTRVIEMAAYFEMTKNIRVIEATGRWQNVHNVPQESLKAMAARWEALPEQLQEASASL